MTSHHEPNEARVASRRVKEERWRDGLNGKRILWSLSGAMYQRKWPEPKFSNEKNMYRYAKEQGEGVNKF